MSNPEYDRQTPRSHQARVSYVLLSVIVASAQCLLGQSASIVILGLNKSVVAQITPDNTLGNESSVVTPDNINGIESDRISGGAVRGSNLFHSFREFNINEGKGAYFDNPAVIQNIFSRVTGSNPSNIMGTLGVLGNANLFFLNPNGIIFGQNASLDLRGSFLATTAESILFPDGNKFSALNPEAPPLLTVNVQQPIGLELEGREGIILTNQGILAVDEGQNLALVGGDLNIDGGRLIALGGRVDLGGLSEAGTIGINNDGSLSFPDGVARAEVSFLNGAFVVVRAGGGGFISINSRNLELREGSVLLAGIAPNSASPEAIAGDIVINATDTITVSQRSGIANEVAPEAEGNSGGIEIRTTDLALTNGGTVSASTFGVGEAGKITISASGTITAKGESPQGFINGIGSIVGATGKGNSGEINITTTDLSLFDGSVVNTSTFGEGDAGKITISASGTITVEGESSQKVSSSIGSIVGATGKGDSGGITITTTDLSLFDGGIVNASTDGEGDAGKITISASGTITAKGESPQGFISGIGSIVGATGKGNSGEINITTTDLSLFDGGIVNASTFGEGDAGKITISASGTITAKGESPQKVSSSIGSIVGATGKGNSGEITITTTDLSLFDGTVVSTSTLGVGDAGKITINAKGTISADGEDSRGFGSGIYSRIFGVGNSGEVEINTTDLSLTQGGRVSASTFGRGNGGAININVFDRLSASRDSGIFSQAGETGLGNSGDINIATTDLSLTQGSRVSASTFGRGNGGNININASGTILVDGESPSGDISSISSQVTSTEVVNSEEIKITTNNLSLTPENSVDANSIIKKDGKRIIIEVDSTIIVESEFQSELTSGITSGVGETGVGSSGAININTTDLSLTQGSRVTTSTFGQGNAGEITINAFGTILVKGESPSGVISSISSQVLGEGNSGGIAIKTNNLSVIEGGFLGAIPLEQGDTGEITINALGTILVKGESPSGVISSISSQVLGEGNSGGIAINTNNLSVTEGGLISTSTFGEVNGGKITINAEDNILVDGQSQSGSFSRIFSQVGDDREGNSEGIEITTNNLSLANGGRLSASTLGVGDAGNLIIHAPQAVVLTNGSQLTVETSAAGKPGNIFITTPSLTIGKDSQLSATATATSTNNEGGGSITIHTSNLDLTGQLGIFAETQGETPAGTLSIQPYSAQTDLNIQFSDTAILSTLTTASGAGGDINLTAPETINIQGEGRITAETRGSGNAGSINIETNNLNISNQTEISASTSGIGAAGDINLTAARFNLVEGVNLFTNTSSNAAAGDIRLNITDSIDLSNSTIRAGTTEGSTGNGGNIIIDPATMTIQEGAEIAVDSQGSGEGGNITLQAGFLTLDEGKITAETTSNQGGDITLTIFDRLRLRNKSQITATAGTEEAGGDGGNIEIKAPFILAVPQENSDITANAFRGDGGNVTLNSPIILGIEFREEETALSDITASSEFGQPGEVEINTSGVDPTRGLNNLPQEATETEVAQSCQEANGQTTLEFFDMGRGGLPPTPEDLFSSDVIIAEWIPLDLETEVELPPDLTQAEIGNITLLNSFPCRESSRK